jgi:hypothetical protein
VAAQLATAPVLAGRDPLIAEDVSRWSNADKFGDAMRRSLPRLGPEAREEIEKLLTPEALAIVAGVLVLWVGSHFIGIGEIVDIVVLTVGVFAIGLAVFDGVGELSAFATTALGARREEDLDRASVHFANAVAILGVQAVLAVLFRGAPKTFRGGRLNVGPPPPVTPGRAYSPTLRSTRSLPAAAGSTTFWGDIVISRLGTAADRRLVALHESVHRALMPKLYFLRQFRVQNRAASYTRSTLAKYLEEALAETIAQVGVHGFQQVFKGIAFPIREKYVTLVRSERVFAAHGIEIILPIAPEALGLFAGSILVSGMRFDVFMAERRPAERPQ